MPQILNIGIDTIETRTTNLIKTSNITRHGNNLISVKYFNQLIATLKQKLQIQGRVQLEEIAIQHELNIKFVQQLVTEHLTELKAELVHNQLRTKQYTLLKKAQMIGFLGALNSPISLDSFLKHTDIQKLNVQQIILELIKQQKLKGRYEGSYFIPHKFTLNQNKLILQFYENNGFIDSEMLTSKFLINKPQEWIGKNLPKDYSKIQNICFKPQKLQSFAAQINSLIKTDGFLELSNIFPIEFQQKNLQEFIQSYCGIKDFIICNNLCYSSQWIEKLSCEFKEKLIWNIFFKKQGKNDKGKKKGGKKQKVELLTVLQLQEVLFNYGYTDYSTSQNLAPQILPLILQTLDANQKKLEKQLVQNKGIINNTFLKYRTCKTICRTEQSLTRTINIICKQHKKGEKWYDSQFGPNDNDKEGLFGLIYYDAVIPKGWPSLQGLKWQQVNLLQQPQFPPHKLVKKNHLAQLLQIIQHLNTKHNFKIHSPDRNKPQDIIGPWTYQFFISEKEKRYVVVDIKLPMIDGRLLFSCGRQGLLQKAYSKLRYCYKGIMNIGIQQLILQITGLTTERLINDNEKDSEMNMKMIEGALKKGQLIFLLGQGQADKSIIFENKQTKYESMKLYCLYLNGDMLQIYPGGGEQVVELKPLMQIFKNMVVVNHSKFQI